MQIERERFEKLFSTPVLRYKVAADQDLNAKLLEEGERMRAATL